MSWCPSSRARLLLSRRFDYSAVAKKGSTPTEAAAPEPTEHFLEARFIDATGVLVGQSGGMKNTKSSKSCSCHSRAACPKLETINIEVSESGDNTVIRAHQSLRGGNSQGSMYHANARKYDSRWSGGLSVPFQRRTEDYLRRETLRPTE